MLTCRTKDSRRGQLCNSCLCAHSYQHRGRRAARKFRLPQRQVRAQVVDHVISVIQDSVKVRSCAYDDDEECEWFPLFSLGTHEISPDGIPLDSSDRCVRARITVSNLFHDKFCDALLHGSIYSVTTSRCASHTLSHLHASCTVGRVPPLHHVLRSVWRVHTLHGATEAATPPVALH